MEQTKISFWLVSSQQPFSELMLTSWLNKTIIPFRQETLSMELQEIRRVQRLGSFRKVLLQLEKAVQIVSTERIAGDEHSLMQNGLMQRYEFSVQPYSDVDITLVGTALDGQPLIRISTEIDDLLLPYFFDISIYHTLSNPALITRIDSTGSVVYESK